MRIKFNRKKPRNPLVSVINRISKLSPRKPDKKLKFYLKLNWIFWRLSLEQADKMYGFSDDSMRRKNLSFLMNKIKVENTILDVGCKFGRISSLLAEKSTKVVGIDMDNSAIEIAKKQNVKDNLEFRCIDCFELLEEESSEFDVIVLSHILEHLDNPEDFLTKFNLTNKYIYIEVPDFDESYLNLYRHKVGSTLIYTDHDHIWEFDRDDFRKLLSDCGLKIISEEFRYGVQKYWCRSL